MWKTIHMQMKILFSLENNAKMRIKMDKILEKWDEILSTVKHEHDISDISFDTWIRPLEVYGQSQKRFLHPVRLLRVLQSHLQS